MSDIAKAMCLCAGGCSALHLWNVAYGLTMILLLITMVEVYFLWRRCNERRRRIAALRKRMADRRAQRGFGDV